MAGIEIATGELMLQPFNLLWERLSERFECDCDAFVLKEWRPWHIETDSWTSSEDAFCPHHASFIQKIRDNADIIFACDFWDHRKDRVWF